MISSAQWASLLHFSRGDFRYPDKLVFPVVQGVDRLASLVGVKPMILSDWRPFDPNNSKSQHYFGSALDLVFPGTDTLKVLALIRSSKLFTGFGLYQNELNEQSFHVDNRTDRTVDNPATWGGIITRPADDAGRHVRRTVYVALESVVNMVKKNSSSVLVVLSLCLFAWMILRPKI